MAIRKHKSGGWLIDVSFDGNRKTAVLPADTPKPKLELAEQRIKLDLMEAAVTEADSVVEQKVAAGGWTLERGYRNSLLVRPKWKKPEQIANCEKQWRVVSKYISPRLLLAELDTERLDEFVAEVMDDRPIGGSTVNRYLSFISAILTDAADRHKLAHLPHIPRQEEGEGRIRWLTEEEEDKFMATALRMEYREVADAAKVFIDSGMRMGELWTTEAWQVDFDAGVLMLTPVQTKTNRGRALPLTDAMRAVLTPRAAAGGLVFPEFSTEGFHRKFVKISKAAGLEHVIPYTCRHTCCTRLVRRGVPLFAVAEHMGHSNLQTTRRYAHFAPQDKDTIRQVLQGATWGAAVASQGIVQQ